MRVLHVLGTCVSRVAVMLAVVVLGGCASSPKLTLDDGRRIDDRVLTEIIAFGDGQRALRPAIVRSSQLKDRDCDKQWELPFAAFSTDKLPEADRVAWIRALGVDERLRVIASSPESTLELGDRIVAVGSVKQDDGAGRMAEELAKRRDAGSPFAVDVLGSTGVRRVSVTPVQVCRGLVQLAAPGNPRAQDYHWLRSIHPLELVKADLTEDEALWVVLWTQGLSEEGGVRMKALSYGMSAISTGFMIAQLVAVANPLAAAGQIANKVLADQARQAVLVEFGKQQLAAQAKEIALSQAQKKLQELAESVAKGQGVAAMQRAATNRGALVGISWAAGTVFDQADMWAEQRMRRLQADPSAAFSLHRKLTQREAFSNGLIFDEPRFERAIEAAASGGWAEGAFAALEPLIQDPLAFDAESMPLASDPRGVRLDESLSPARPKPQAPAAVAGSLAMPLATGAASGAAPASRSGSNGAPVSSTSPARSAEKTTAPATPAGAGSSAVPPASESSSKPVAPAAAAR